MKSKIPNARLLRWAALPVLLSLSANCSFGQGADGIAVPLYVGNVFPLKDEYGRAAMQGSPAPSAAPLRPRVEIRRAYPTAYDPAGIKPCLVLDGGAVSSPYNALVTETNFVWKSKPAGSAPADSVGGIGQNAAPGAAGHFSILFPVRPPAGQIVFARAYNAPTLEEATFYADSAPVEITPAMTSIDFTFGPMKALEPGDSDGDGLNDSWERLLGTSDRETSDYDGDRMSDLHEMLAGTSLTDPDSKLAFRRVRSEEATQVRAAGEETVRVVRVAWQAVPGKKYRLEAVPMLAALDPATGTPYAFELVPGGEVVAGPDEHEIELFMELPAGAETGTFRVKLAP